MAEWISVEDRLPPKKWIDVLVAYPPGLIGNDNWIIEITKAMYVNEKPHDYPYWMPLPEPPVERE